MERCHACPGVNKLVPPSIPQGNPQRRIMFIGEAPGKDEDRKGMPFIGKTGREFEEHYLPLAGIKRADAYITNTIKCLPAGYGGKLDLNRSKDLAVLYGCGACHLEVELQTYRPSLIIPMGSFACHYVDSDIELDLHHGIPRETSWGTVFPMWHPAGGIHEPKKMLQIRNDFIRLGKYLKHKLPVVSDDYPIPNYQHLVGHFEYDCAVRGPIACDTEYSKMLGPYCLTFSTEPGTGNLILADDKKALARFQYIIDNTSGPFLLHNRMADEDKLAAMGLRIPPARVVDTMVRCFHLGNLPQGLKALAYRLLGMQMEDFDDLVTPYSALLCLNYLDKARQFSWPKPDEEVVRDKGGQWKLYKPQAMSTKLKRFFTDLGNNPNKDVFTSWDNWEDSHAMIEAELGPWPGKDIRHVPFDKALWYACRDSDATLRLWPVLQRMTRRVRKTLQEGWGD